MFKFIFLIAINYCLFTITALYVHCTTVKKTVYVVTLDDTQDIVDR